MIEFDDYRSFHGTMRVVWDDGKTEDITGYWMFIPRYNCWNCSTRPSRYFRADRCTVLSDETEVRHDEV